MKKILFIIMCMIVLASCASNGESTELPVTHNHVTGAKFYTIEIDGCEYVIGMNGYKGYMAHKGNCKYCAERNKHNN